MGEVLLAAAFICALGGMWACSGKARAEHRRWLDTDIELKMLIGRLYGIENDLRKEGMHVWANEIRRVLPARHTTPSPTVPDAPRTDQKEAE